MKESKKFLQVFSVLALVVAVLGISVGFAAMSTQLNVTGQVKVDPAKWDIKFTKYEFDDYGTDATATTKAAEGTNPAKPIMNDTTFSDYEIVLTKPGDKGSYTVTVTNDGTLDAQLSSVSLGNSLTYTGEATDPAVKASDEAIVENNVTYTITWADGSEIASGSELAHGQSKDLIITAEYPSATTELPTAPVVITGRNLTLTYTQK
ncbi:MAG: hypothetical protein E7158_04030 [Firmicutes bacterium]|nr:hypothetical protein [Bacillota bacterium]